MEFSDEFFAGVLKVGGHNQFTLSFGLKFGDFELIKGGFFHGKITIFANL